MIKFTNWLSQDYYMYIGLSVMYSGNFIQCNTLTSLFLTLNGHIEKTVLILGLKCEEKTIFYIAAF